jgi:hypothetical protein
MEEKIKDAICNNDISKIKEIQAKGYDMSHLSVSDIKIIFKEVFFIFKVHRL